MRLRRKYQELSFNNIPAPVAYSPQTPLRPSRLPWPPEYRRRLFKFPDSRYIGLPAGGYLPKMKEAHDATGE